MTIRYSSTFERNYRSLTPDIQKEAEEKITFFRRDPFTPELRTHKLKGRLAKFWSFSITRKHRLVFQFVQKGEVWFHAIGTHDVYR